MLHGCCTDPELSRKGIVPYRRDIIPTVLGVSLARAPFVLLTLAPLRQVVAVEYDPYWAARLEERFLDDNVRAVRGDALAVRLPDEPFVVVANIPFNITTSILHRLLDNLTTALRSAHLQVQRYVALKHSRSSPTTLNNLRWSSWYEFCAAL